MDDKWFRAQQKRVGVTAGDIAARMGRSRSSISHIYSGAQRMSLDWAQAFADVLQVPLDEVLKHAGVLEEPEAQQLAPGFADADAAPYLAKGNEGLEIKAISKIFGGDRPGVEVWRVRLPALILQGYLPGDFILVDNSQSELVRAGDTVIARKFNRNGTRTTILRRYEPPVLISATTDPDVQRVQIVDGSNVVIVGKVIASWRTGSAAQVVVET